MEGAHIIEVNDLIISMESKLKCGCFGVRKDGNTEFPLLRKIRRVPYHADNDLYEPSVVSIGPYHHKSEATLEMEQTKWESLHYILGLNKEKRMRDYLEAMAVLEGQIRSCYNGIKLQSEELLKMMLLDGCFILCILYGTEGATQPISNLNMSDTNEENLGSGLNVHKPDTRSIIDASHQISSNIIDNDDNLDNTYSSRQWYTSFFAHDLLLLENQIPFLVVAKVYELVTNGVSSITVLSENVARFMEDLLLSYPKAVLKFDQPKEVHHLLHLCHQYFKPNLLEVKSVITAQQLHGWQRATEYHKSGVELKKREFCSENPHSLLDVLFCEGVMEMPCLTIDMNTHCLFHNLIAFEEACPQFGNFITTYVVFLSQLISTPEDAALLTKRGIIVYQLDDGVEVSDLFRMLAQDAKFDFNGEYYLEHTCHEMEMHFKTGRPRWSEWFGSIGSKIARLGS